MEVDSILNPVGTNFEELMMFFSPVKWFGWLGIMTSAAGEGHVLLYT